MIDGREELVPEVAAAPMALRKYVAGELAELSRLPVFASGLEGALPSSPETQSRVEMVIRPRVDAIIGAG